MLGARRKISVQEVNSLAEEFIRAISSEGEHVTVDKVILRLCRHLRVPALKSVKIDAHRDIPAIKELCRTLREINIFIESIEAVRTVCTLYEVGECIAALKAKKHFKELNVGPLCKIPLIHKMFKVPSTLKDEDIVEIETVDIIKNLRVFMRKQKGYKCKVDLPEFMKFISDQYKCDSPYDLGIRIQSIALSISTLRKAVNCEYDSMDKTKKIIQKEIEEEIEAKLRKVKKSLLEPASGAPLYSSSGSSEMRLKYAHMSASDAVMEVFTKAQDIFSKKMAKHVEGFLSYISGDRLAAAMFQMAICCGSLEAPVNLIEKTKPTKPMEENKTVLPPGDADLKQVLHTHISSFNGQLNLAYLSKIEKKMVEHFKFKDFSSMEHGTFLQFLVKHSQILQEAGGGALMISNQDVKNCSLRPSQQDVYELIRQCGATDQTKIPDIEAAIKSHFKVLDTRELGYGTVAQLFNIVQKQKTYYEDHGNRKNLVHYEAALFVKDSRQSLIGSTDSVGLLGDMSKDSAMACLLNAPLLEDLSEWSQWELVFEPQHGNLKDFIERNFGKKVTSLGDRGDAIIADLVALEVRPGVLLRVSANTSIDLFAEAVMALDPVNAAGHLVSIVITYGIANAPFALLGNHMEASLSAANSQREFQIEDRDTLLGSFILDCLIRIPARLCRFLIQQVFLDPFSRVAGQTNSKAVLLQAAKSRFHYQNRLHQMGILMGITDWVKDFNMKLSPPKAPFMNFQMLKPKVNDTASVSSLSYTGDLEEDEDEPDSEEFRESDFESESENVSSDESSDEEIKFTLVDEIDKETSFNKDDGSHLDSSDAKKCLADENEMACRAVIADIRKNEFGIGVELNDEGKKLMEVSQNRLGRSLERLSKELYSKDTHFVLELIQNADDNTYPEDSSVHPSLLFVVEKSCISVLNNEHGFEENNIRAICDVGRSTKGKHKYGYIGQKGIGFKSVFKVTDCPEIHSNGFHICFDKTSGPMGYILPHWLENEKSLTMEIPELQVKSWTTKIVLPLRLENQNMQNLFHDVHPSLLLFLHRLRSLSIVNQIENRIMSITRKDVDHNVLEIQHSDGYERWLVVKRMLSANKIKSNVDCTEVALAFKMNNTDEAYGPRVQPEKQPVFAFLPLRNFGFRFIIQGDFDIPSSREDVDRDSSWNQWLRSEIPQLFLHAMDVFVEHPAFKDLQGLCEFLKFIPLPDEIFDFFKPVAGQIIQLLKGKPFLPTKEDDDGHIEYKLPSQTAVSSDFLIQEVISSEVLHKHLNLSYLNPAVQATLPAALMSVLGVHRLTGSDIVAVTAAVSKELIKGGDNYSEECLVKIAKLMVCNFRTLEHDYSAADGILQELRSIPMIPLVNGRMVALNGQGVFFPLGNSQKEHTGLKGLFKDLNIVDPNLLMCLDPLSNSQVKELLKRLEVHDLEPDKVLLEHIIPILKNGLWKMKPEDTVISYVRFIKEHADIQDLAKWKAYIPVNTNKGFLCPYETNVQFSQEYGNFDLPSKLPGVEWVLLHSCYLETDSDVQSWRDFFNALGVQDLFIFRKVKQCFSKKELESSPWATEHKLWSARLEDIYTVEDYECIEFKTLMTVDHLSEEVKFDQRCELLRLLNDNWNTGARFSQYLKAHVLDSQGQKINETRSSFVFYLMTMPWIPVRNTAHGSSHANKVEFLNPYKVYLQSEELYKLLGAHVKYIPIYLNPSDFAVSIGIKINVTVEEMLILFKSWCTSSVAGSSREAEGGYFTTTTEHIYFIYKYLYQNCNHFQLKELFRQTPAVFVEYERREDSCSGKFYYMKEVCWSDPTGMFQKYRDLIRGSEGAVQEPRVLAPFYNQNSEIKDLFLKSLNIDKIPSMKQYVDLLEVICAEWPLPPKELLQDVSAIYAILAKKCKIHVDNDIETQVDVNYRQSLKEMLKDKNVFPTKGNCWVSLARQPLIPDKKDLEWIFKQSGQVCLLNLPPADLKYSLKAKSALKQGKQVLKENQFTFEEKDRALFLEICGVKKLSQCIIMQAQTENYRPCPAMQHLVRQLVPYIQKFLYNHAAVYQELEERNISEAIKSLSFGQVGKLYILYELRLSNMEPLIEKEDVICLLKDNKELYIQKDHLNARLEICRELVKMFSSEDKDCEKELERFLQMLMSYLDDQAALKRFLCKEDIKELPETVEKWEVPEPKEMMPEPKVHHLDEQMLHCFATENVMDNTEAGEKGLTSWPPKSSFHGVPNAVTSGESVNSVLKMWPPPAEPSSVSVSKLHHPTHDGSKTTFDETRQPSPPLFAATHSGLPLLRQHSGENSSSLSSLSKPDNPNLKDNPTDPLPEGQMDIRTLPDNSTTLTSEASKVNFKPATSDLYPCLFQGGADIQRPPIPLDKPIWAQRQPPEAVLEDLPIDSSVCLPKAAIFPEDTESSYAIGRWGETLVYAFLTNWKENGTNCKPLEIVWNNMNSESGQPYDFKVTFTPKSGQGLTEVFIEVKATMKSEKHFIHISANELDLALKQKENYHIYRVYNAGDSHNVRLCRIRNLAQCLHSKQLELFLFV
ncbi:protein NO VEIN [Polypterus senegalus]|uniref:protein NO VEIN n=1 Tax=Polypterus senegalus TaxID=55291 RepID=UPI0019627F30|nr:protein NO VEIN [Polypterus senegalus]